jgi:hypothetical protein
MLPNTSTEGNSQQLTGGTEQPTSSPSGNENQPFLDLVQGLEGRIAEQETQIKGLQKGTDKRFGQMDTNIKRILELKDQGMNESQIQRELFLDQMIQGQSAPEPAQPQGNGQAQGPAFDMDGMIKTLQFADNDPALAALKIKYSGNPQELVKAAADLRIQQLTGTGPTPGTGLSQTGGQVSGAVDYDALSAEYETLSRNPAANFERMSQIQTEMDKIK